MGSPGESTTNSPDASPVKGLRRSILSMAMHPRAQGGLLVAFLTLLYMLIWWNRFLGGGSDGTFMVMGGKLLRGQIPYRDFYMVTTPFMALKFAAMIRVFGDSLVRIRMIGVLDRVVLAVLVYAWLSRLFSAKGAVVGALLSIVVFSADVADAVEYYPTDAAIWSVAAALCASILLDTRDARRSLGWAFASGVFAGVAALIKQTTGLGVMVLLPFVCGFVISRRDFWMALKVFVMCALGSSIPVGLVVFWLGRSGALPMFVNQVFREGASSKGSVGSVFLRPWVRPFEPDALPVTALSFAIAALLYVSWRYSKKSDGQFSGSFFYPAAGGLVLSLVGIVGLLITGSESFPIRTPLLSMTLITFFGTAGAALFYFIRCFSQSSDQREGQLFLFAAFSFALSYMVGMSWTPYEPMALPGIGLLVCLALSRGCSPGDSWTKIGELIIVGSFAVIGCAVFLKIALPFSWANWTDPTLLAATGESKLPALRGMRLPPATVKTVETVTNLIQANSRPDEPIVVYPYLPLFYVFSERQPALFAVVHWLDVAPDRLCLHEAATLLKIRPRVIVYQEIEPARLQFQETAFRGGRPSGQRYLIDAIHQLTKTYRLAGSVPEPVMSNPINVYVAP